MPFRQPKKRKPQMPVEYKNADFAHLPVFEALSPGAGTSSNMRNDLAMMLDAVLDARASRETTGQCQFIDGVLTDARIVGHAWNFLNAGRVSVGMEMIRGVFERYATDYSFCRLVCVIAAAMESGGERFDDASIVNATMIALLRRSAGLPCGLNVPKGAG